MPVSPPSRADTGRTLRTLPVRDSAYVVTVPGAMRIDAIFANVDVPHVRDVACYLLVPAYLAIRE